MFDYLVIVDVLGIKYLTKVKANSIFNAERIILDRGYKGYRYSTITSCNAYGHDGIKTEAFYDNMLYSTPIELSRLLELIDRQNDNIYHTDMIIKERENKAAAL